jgi:hypothetical protein
MANPAAAGGNSEDLTRIIEVVADLETSFGGQMQAFAARQAAFEKVADVASIKQRLQQIEAADIESVALIKQLVKDRASDKAEIDKLKADNETFRKRLARSSAARPNCRSPPCPCPSTS